MRCTLSSSCHRIVLATAPGVPTPQHRFSDPQKLAAGFQLAFSRTGPKTVSCSPLPVVRFGGEHNVLSLHTHHRSSQDCTCRPAVAMMKYRHNECVGQDQTQNVCVWHRAKRTGVSATTHGVHAFTDPGPPSYLKRWPRSKGILWWVVVRAYYGSTL